MDENEEIKILKEKLNEYLQINEKSIDKINDLNFVNTELLIRIKKLTDENKKLQMELKQTIEDRYRQIQILENEIKKQ